MSFVDETVWRPLVETALAADSTLLRISKFEPETDFAENLKNLHEAIREAIASPFDLEILSRCERTSANVRSYGDLTRLAVIEDLLLRAPGSLPRDNVIAYLMEGKPHRRKALADRGLWTKITNRLFDRYDAPLYMATWILITESSKSQLWEGGLKLIGIIKRHVLPLELRPGLMKMRNAIVIGGLRSRLEHEINHLADPAPKPPRISRTSPKPIKRIPGFVTIFLAFITLSTINDA